MRLQPSRRQSVFLLLALAGLIILGVTLYVNSELSALQESTPTRYPLGKSLGTVPVTADTKQLTVQGDREVYWFIVETPQSVPLDVDVYAECVQGGVAALVAASSRMPLVRGDSLDVCQSS